MEALLERALGALDEGRGEEALEALLGAWGRCRDPSVAVLIERLSSSLARARPGPGGATEAERQERWLALAAEGRAADLGRLLPELAAGRKAANALARLAALNERAPDPRIASRIVALIEAPPFRAQGEALRSFWRAAFRVLFDHADPRALARLRELAGHHAERLGGQAIGELFERQTSALLPKLEARLGELVRPLSPAAARARAAVDELLGRQESADSALRRERLDEGSEAAFLEAIADQPEADEPRLVFADWLAERGDPRGELIQLQCLVARGAASAAQERRAATLCRKHLKALLGPFDGVITRQSARFERGFLVAGEINAPNNRDLARLVGHPAWATVRELSYGPSSRASYLEAFRHPIMRSLRVLRRISPEELVALCLDRTERPLEALTVRYDAVQLSSLRPAFERCRGLPALRSLELALTVGSVELGWLLGTGLGRRLHHLGLATSFFTGDRGWLGRWREALEAEATAPLEELQLVVWSHRLVLSRGPAGAWSALRLIAPPRGQYALAASSGELLALLDELPARSLTALSFDGLSSEDQARAAELASRLVGSS